MDSEQRGANLPLVAAVVMLLTLGSLSVGFAQGPKLDVPYVPTEMAVVNEMLRLANVSKDDFLIDLGSGDGRIPIAAAKLHGTRGLGVDIDPRRVAEARRAEVRQVADKVEFKREDVCTLKIKNSNLYLWIVPAQVEGRWQLEPSLDGQPTTINIMQRFQHIAGIAKIKGRSVPLRRAELEADRIKFELALGEGQNKRYEGRALDDRLVGEDWSASRIEQ
jgi:hypothetical protein